MKINAYTCLSWFYHSQSLYTDSVDSFFKCSRVDGESFLIYHSLITSSTNFPELGWRKEKIFNVGISENGDRNEKKRHAVVDGGNFL